MTEMNRRDNPFDELAAQYDAWSGGLVVGLIPADSPWGRRYSQKAVQGHPIYSAAAFYRPDETIHLAASAGLDLRDAYSCLLASPEAIDAAAQPRQGIAPNAGFVAMRFTKHFTGESLRATTG
ncbi:MAG: hypothetical protein RBS80_28475 [Thermoguttaceae bacterium]|jgi:hypothetical protein|nr:hypothetical protein [Thermoguttaceae bacterium]